MAKVKFGDVVKEVKNKIDRNNNPYEFYVAGDHMDTDSLSIPRRGSFLTDDVGPAFIREFKKGQVLYGSRRTYLRKVAVADFDGVTANTTFVLETKDENVLRQRLLPFIMYTEGFTAWSIKKSRGSTNPYVLFKDLSDYEFDLPSIEEQDKLADVLWSINDTLQAYQNLLAETDKLTNAQFEILFGQGQWETVSADTIFTDMRNGVSPSSKGEYNEKVLTLSAITQGAFDPSAWKQGTFDTPPSEDKRICTEDFYMCRGNGNRALVGVGVYSTEERADLVYPDTVIAARIDKQKVCLPYLCCAWKQHFVRNQIEAAAKTTNGIYKINQKSLSQVQIILPPITLQHRFSEFLFQVDKAKFPLQNTITSLQATKRCILEDALGTGRKE